MRNAGYEKELAKLEAELKCREVDDFLAFLRLKNLKLRTQVEYLAILRLFRQRLQDNGKPFGQVTSDELRDFVRWSQAQGLSPKTVANRAIILKRFFGFLLEEGYIAVDPGQRLPVPKVPGRLPKALSKEQIQKLFAQLSETPLFRFRDKVIVTLMYTSGLRISEAVGLTREQFDLSHGSLRVLGKGSKERRVFLRPDVLELIKRYLGELGDTVHLFPSPRGGRITQNHIQIEVGKYARKAGLPKGVTAHTLRHTCATHYLMGGAPITFVQGLLGHASLNTTGLYTGLVDDVAREIALRVPLAIDEEPPQRRPGLSVLREPGEPYALWDLRSASNHVGLVAEWLAD